MDPGAAAAAAAAELAARTGIDHHDIAVVLGSGWRPAADVIGVPQAEVPIGELPGFVAPNVVGHGGTARSVKVGDKNVLILLGRTHYYEGRGIPQTVHNVRTATAAGCTTVILTNAAGGLRQGMRVGQPVLISDHLNLTAASPLVGARFVDLTDLYSPRLRAVAKEIDPSLEEGVYAGLPARTSRPRPRSACCARWARTWSACPRCWRPSRPAPRAPRCSACPW